MIGLVSRTRYSNCYSSFDVRDNCILWCMGRRAKACGDECCTGFAGQYGLAYVTAATYGLEEDAVRLAGILEEAGVDPLPDLEPEGGQLLAPPAPILHEANWPLLTVQKGFFEALAAGARSIPASLNIVPFSPTFFFFGGGGGKKGGVVLFGRVSPLVHSRDRSHGSLAERV